MNYLEKNSADIHFVNIFSRYRNRYSYKRHSHSLAGHVVVKFQKIFYFFHVTTFFLPHKCNFDEKVCKYYQYWCLLLVHFFILLVHGLKSKWFHNFSLHHHNSLAVVGFSPNRDWNFCGKVHPCWKYAFSYLAKYFLGVSYFCRLITVPYTSCWNFNNYTEWIQFTWTSLCGSTLDILLRDLNHFG